MLFQGNAPSFVDRMVWQFCKRSFRKHTAVRSLLDAMALPAKPAPNASCRAVFRHRREEHFVAKRARRDLAANNSRGVLGRGITGQ